MYRLRGAPKQLLQHACEYPEGLGYKSTKVDPALFINHKFVTVFVVYVGDMIAAGPKGGSRSIV